MDAIDKYAADITHIRRTERAAARMALDELDKKFKPSPERDAVRQRLLDSMAWFRTEMEQWLTRQSDESSPGPENVSPD